MSDILISTYSSPVGDLIIGSFKNQLCICDWKMRKNRERVDNRIQRNLNAHFKQGTSLVIEQTIKQLTEYFDRQRNEFTIPLNFAGSDFQQSVWKALVKIPYGTTSTYRALAKLMNQPKAVRAIANANGANAISILVPCHRIIGSDGSLVGYAGGLEAKKELLILEQWK